MDSLVANYASSDEEEEHEQVTTHSASPLVPTSSPSSSCLLFSSLPNPKPSTSPSSSSSSSPFFASLPQPKQQQFRPNIATVVEEEDNYVSDPKRSIQTRSSTSSLFSAPPQPKTLTPHQPSSEQPIPKKVVQFRPPSVSSATSLKQPAHDSDDEEEEQEHNRRKAAESQIESSSSVRSFLSSIPAPKNSSSSVLGGGLLPSAANSSRRSIIETQAAPSSNSAEGQLENQNETLENYASYQSGLDQSAENYVSYGSYESGEINQHVAVGDASTYGSYYGDYGNYGDHVDYGQYANNWADGSAAAAVQETAGAVGESAVGMLPKRKRNEVPTEIVEVKQDELIKNRPREDQVRSTGVAFGPSYQPASTKGKPSKLHKRKHQIGSLYFDMKQKEMELAERRSRGLLTKAETHAKYGW